MRTGIAELHATPVQIPIGGHAVLDADVAVPAQSIGVVVFAHGSGSSRHSSRNRFVASELDQRRMATVLADLLTPNEERIDEQTRALRFDIGMLTERVVKILDWLPSHRSLAKLPAGLFGASTGAAAALDAAAVRSDQVRAVVSRGGRPDLATRIAVVRAPTLLIVGGNDPVVIDLNAETLQRLKGIRRMEVVPGASHLFEESGTLERVAELAGRWFAEYLPPSRPM